MMCPALTHATYAIKIKVGSQWPQTQAVKAGMGDINIWYRATFDVDS